MSSNGQENMTQVLQNSSNNVDIFKTPPKKTCGKIETVYVQIADHPSQKKKIPLQIDMHLPASALIHEVARAPRIFLEKLSVEYVDRLWPQDGLNRSCRDNFIREGTCLVATRRAEALGRAGIGASAWEQEALAEVRVQKKKAQTEGGEDGEEEGV
ncbi:hypothetical protein NSK_008309 [Nannochloropsis salina CCMP1776]|uniref:Uncharacterized protein n=1 Tax=Nannochloropsis salina CCMP1776 TaxID=1027361 RepID=A0A4D9CS38_9STRA|nr:hypothetical protein NSK_008309 [Nannochloropsis salina CCMP1776]|eukprot:TFJ80343.1 hypothetical protein NSK_008309 [Nannochloropsis salina CCMP1776]